MTKLVVLWLLILAAISPQCLAQRSPQIVTCLKIAESTGFFESTTYSITNSSINVKRKHDLLNDSAEYSRKITVAERNKMLRPLDQRYLTSWKDQYQDYFADQHGASFYFTIVKGNAAKTISVFKAKVPVLVEVCQQMNALLPKEFWIYYPTDITTY